MAKEQQQSAFEIITLALAEAHHLGKTGARPGARFHAENATRALFSQLAEAGTVICPVECYQAEAQAEIEAVRLHSDTDAIGNLSIILKTVELGLKLEREKVKLARAMGSVDTTSGPIDLPGPVAKVTVATDTTPDGTNVCTFGWSEDGKACWLLNHTFVSSLKAAA